MGYARRSCGEFSLVPGVRIPRLHSTTLSAANSAALSFRWDGLNSKGLVPGALCTTPSDLHQDGRSLPVATADIMLRLLECAP